MQDKEEKNIIYEQFIFGVNSVTGKAYKGNSKTAAQLKTRLTEGYTLEQILVATKNCFNDPFHKQNTHYLTPDFILRVDKLEKYLNIKRVDVVEEKREAPKKDFFKVDFNPNA